MGQTIETVTKEIMAQTQKVMVGKTEQIEMILASLLAKGHVLLDDMPGVGKTTLIKTLSKALGFEFKRIQFTPDLLPSDVIGMNIFDRNTSEFRFVKGPVHTNILLADEINRAIPRTQSALLESMEERQVTIDGVSTPLPKPFFVLATQNPVESESTFQLPAAQMDRFLVRLSLGYPTPEEEAHMMKQVGESIPFDQVQVVTNAEQFVGLQEEVAKVSISDEVISYIVSVVQATRNSADIRHGSSPRGSLALQKITKAYAAMQGREYVTPDDVKVCAVSVLAHRITLSGNARLSGNKEEDCIKQILDQVGVHPQKEQMADGK